MTDSTQCFIPLNSDSQHDTDNVFYYDAGAPLEAIYNCATGRMQAVINLLSNLYEYKNGDPVTLSAVAVVCSLLLNDAYSLISTLAPRKLDVN